MLGRTIGKYRIIEQIGRGGMGTVYKAVDETLDRQVAIKVLNAELIEPDSVERFRREAMTLARLNHPKIGKVHELSRDGHDLLMVMEFLDGETFEKLIERAAPLPVPQAVGLCCQVLDALQYAHGAGVIHRDLKPANIIVTPSGDIKVMDFGIARVQGTEHLTSHGFMVGTPAYMAPEQIRGEEVDPRMDLYAIAVVLYRLLTQRLPFQGDTTVAMIHSQLNNAPTPPHQFRADLPQWLVAILVRGLAKAAGDRFQTAEEFRVALENGLAGKTRNVPAVLPNDIEETLAPMRTPPLPMAVPVRSAAPAPTAPSAASGSMPAPAPPPSAKPEPTVTLRAPHIATAAVVTTLLIVAVVLLAIVVLRRQSTTIAPGTDQTAATQPAASSDTIATPADATPPPSGAPGASPSQTPAVAAAAPSPAATAAAGATAAPVARPAPSSAARGAASGSNVAATGRRSTPARPASEPAQPVNAEPAPEPTPADAPTENFGDVKTLVVDGAKGREVDALLSLEPGNLVVRNKADGTVLRTVPYRSIAAASYVLARRPRAQKDAGVAQVPENLGSGFFGSSRHWLTLQTATEFLIVRLEDKNVIAVLRSIETRTGAKVRRN